MGTLYRGVVYRVGLLGLQDILKVVAGSDVSWERWISVLSINA